MIRNIFPLFIMLALLAIAPISAQDISSHYEVSDCPEIVFWMAYDEIDAVSCGVLHVPADRAMGADSPMLQLFVLWLAALHDRGNAPVVYLEGGPGGAASASLEDLLGSALRTEHELILIDQRGTGLSLPSLNCPEDEATNEDPLAACRARLVAVGIDLAAFNSAANAHDVQDLLTALDLPVANVYGISYGTRLALTLARDFPQRLRAIILDGVYPPQAQVLIDQAANGNLAFERMFADCAASPACSQAYPDLRDSFGHVIDTLSQEPADIVDLQSGEPTWMDGEVWANFVFGLLYDTSLLPWLPAMISAHAAGEYDYEPPMSDEMLPADEVELDDTPLPDFLLNYDDDSEGMYYSVICAEDVPFDRADDVIAAGAQLPPRIDAALTKASLQAFDDCRVWDVPAADASQKLPVVSDIPTLLFSGAYDPITPPAWAEAAAQSLSASWHVVFPAAGHGALGSSDCADRIALAFLSQPNAQPDSSCLEALEPPDFQSE